MRLPFLLSLVITLMRPVGAQVPTLSRDFVAGCESCGGALQFSSIGELALSAKGEVLVTDRDAPMLRLLDGTGAVVWQGGTRGGGPGEYQFVLRAAFTPDGLVLLDLSNARVTTLSPTYEVLATYTIGTFVTTAGADGSGSLIMGAEGPTGSFRAIRWRAGVSTVLTLPAPSAGTSHKNASIAVSPTGVIAFMPDADRYEIIRVDASGRRLADLTRAIERVQRTPDEEAALRARIASRGALVAAEAGSRGSAGASRTPPASGLSLKPHAVVDGMRYDPGGRLWIRTMRGNGTVTIFDVFAASGEFLGAVTLPGAINAFALGGRWLATASENEDGVPQVTRWTVR